jgi:hypothetical protein
MKTGVQAFCKCSENLDSGFRRNDEKRRYWTSYERITILCSRHTRQGFNLEPPSSVIPAEAGIQTNWDFWTPAFAGVTALMTSW